MTDPNQPFSNPELHHDEIEQFMPLYRMRAMAQMTLVRAGRIDHSGVVQPIEVERRLHGDKWLMGPLTDPAVRTDLFVPTKEQEELYIDTDEVGLTTKNSLQMYSISSLLYECLTDGKEVHLSPDEAASISRQKARLEHTLSQNPLYKWRLSEEQLEDAYHVSPIYKPEPEFADTRVYVPGGVNALGVAEAVFAAGADMRAAKIWAPIATTARQRIRQDAPLFEVTTYDQLNSVVGTLRRLSAEGKIPAGRRPLVGHEIDDLPGVYVGQTRSNDSFNGRVEDLFGSAIQEAASEIKLHAGDIVNPDIMTDIAERARELAQSKATTTGTDPSNHAFLAEQPVNNILEAIRTAR